MSKLAVKVTLDMTGYAGLPTHKLGDTSNKGKACVANVNYHLSNNYDRAGAVRPSEGRHNVRKCANVISNDSSQMHSLMTESSPKPSPKLGGLGGVSGAELPLKKPLRQYVAEEDQKNYFQTRWKPDEEGRMAFCVGRKNGSARIYLDYDHLDRDSTYHTWKRMLGGYAKTAASSIQYDRFLTVRSDANRSDRISNPVNRAPPFANPDGPFEVENYKLIPAQVDHLDRTCTPRVTVPRSDAFLPQKCTKFYRKFINNLEPAPEKTGICLTADAEKLQVRRGLRQANNPWLIKYNLVNWNRMNSVDTSNSTESVNKGVNKSKNDKNEKYENELHENTERLRNENIKCSKSTKVNFLNSHEKRECKEEEERDTKESKFESQISNNQPQVEKEEQKEYDYSNINHLNNSNFEELKSDQRLRNSNHENRNNKHNIAGEECCESKELSIKKQNYNDCSFEEKSSKKEKAAQSFINGKGEEETQSVNEKYANRQKEEAQTSFFTN